MSWPNASRSCTCSISSIDFSPANLNATSSRSMLAQFCGPHLIRSGGNRRRVSHSRIALLRASLINALGDLNDKEIVAGCRERFQKVLVDPTSLAPDLRAPVFAVVGRYADERDLEKLHELGGNDEHRREAKLLRRARVRDRSRNSSRALWRFRSAMNCRPAARFTSWPKWHGKVSIRTSRGSLPKRT